MQGITKIHENIVLRKFGTIWYFPKTSYEFVKIWYDGKLLLTQQKLYLQNSASGHLCNLLLPIYWYPT